jgi:hypothetical protein
MKRTILTGEKAIETKKQLEDINAINASIKTLSTSVYKTEKKLWEFLKKEIPNMSENCTICINDDGDVVFTDRLSDDL